MNTYIIGAVVLAVILIYTIFKCKYGFWINQPVYHMYDISYSAYNPQVIQTKLPENNKYVDNIHITTKWMSTFSEIEWTLLVVFLQKYFIREANNVYSPKLDNVVPYFKDAQSLCSFYYTNKQYNNNTDGTIIVNNKHIDAVMTSRPIFCILHKQHIPVYYVDYLCVSTKKRKSGLAQKMIQTHHFNQRRMNTHIQVSLFKRETEMTWIVPITYYDTHVYNIDDYTDDIRIHARYQIIDSSSGILPRIMEFISTHSDKYEACMYDCMESIRSQIDTNNLYIYALINKDTSDGIVAVYIFKNPRVTIMHYNVITCIGSIQGNVSSDVFYYVFIKLIQRMSNSGKLLAVENTSDNGILLQKMSTQKPMFISPTAYFLYNYICQPIPSNKCLILI